MQIIGNQASSAIQQPKHRIALLFLSAGTLSSGFASILIRLCLYPAPAVASLRMLLAGILLLPFCLTNLWRTWKDRGLSGFLWLLLPGLLLSAHLQCWVLALRHTSVANGTFILSLNPVFFALFQRFFTRQRLSAYALASLGLAIAGALWLFLIAGGRLGRMGDLLALAANLLAVAYLLTARRVAVDLPHLAVAQTIYFWGGLAGLLVVLFTGSLPGVRLADTGSLAALIGLVLFPTLVGHTAKNFGVRHLRPLTVSFFSVAEPVIATFAALIILREPLRPRILPAYILIMAATLLYLIFSAQRREE